MLAATKTKASEKSRAFFVFSSNIYIRYLHERDARTSVGML